MQIRTDQALVDAKVLSAGLAALRVLLRFERDLLTFVERAQACAFDSRDVNENVRSAIVGLNEAKTLGRVEPLNCSGSHVTISKMRICALPTRPPCRLDPISTMSWGWAGVGVVNKANDNSNAADIGYFPRIAMVTDYPGKNMANGSSTVRRRWAR